MMAHPHIDIAVSIVSEPIYGERTGTLCTGYQQTVVTSPSPVRLLVFGSSDSVTETDVFEALDRLHAVRPLSVIIENGERGAPRFARHWAMANDLLVETYEAEWDNIRRCGAVVRSRGRGRLYDASAGCRRNQRMIDHGLPDLALGFVAPPDDVNDMQRRLIMAQIEVIQQ